MKFIETVAFWHTASKGTLDNEIIFSFDLDHTLIHPKSGAKFARSASDWKWQTDDTKGLLLRIAKFATVVIFTNQGGVIADRTKKSFQNLEGRIEQVLRELNLPNIRVYAACKNPMTHKYRKPSTGMWDLLVKDLSVKPNLDKSIFVGDAAGRRGDHSDCDLKFAKEIGLEFLVPEDFEAQVAELEQRFQESSHPEPKASQDSKQDLNQESKYEHKEQPEWETTQEAKEESKYESNDEVGTLQHKTKSLMPSDGIEQDQLDRKTKIPKLK